MTCIISFENQNYTIYWSFLAEIQSDILFQRYLLEKYDMYHIQSKSKLYNLNSLLAEIQSDILFKGYLLENLDV